MLASVLASAKKTALMRASVIPTTLWLGTATPRFVAVEEQRQPEPYAVTDRHCGQCQLGELRSWRARTHARVVSQDSLHRRAGLDSHGLQSVGVHRGDNLLRVRAVARLDGDVELGPFRRHVQKQPAVSNFQNVGAEFAETARDLTEHARPVGNGQPEANDAAVALELAHHDRGENARGDIATAQNEADLLTAETAGLRQHRRQD